MTTSVDACLAAAQACLARGEGEQALRAMQEAAQGAPDNPAVLAGLGVALRFNGQLAAAADAFSRCLAVQPERADAQVYLGMIRLADHVIDLGPEGGDKGGEVVYQGDIPGLVACERSYTGKYLKQYSSATHNAQSATK